MRSRKFLPFPDSRKETQITITHLGDRETIIVLKIHLIKIYLKHLHFETVEAQRSRKKLR